MKHRVGYFTSGYVVHALVEQSIDTIYGPLGDCPRTVCGYEVHGGMTLRPRLEGSESINCFKCRLILHFDFGDFTRIVRDTLKGQKITRAGVKRIALAADVPKGIRSLAVSRACADLGWKPKPRKKKASS